MLKKLLYPEFFDRAHDLSEVKKRQHKTECIIITRQDSCRLSIINCDSDSDTDSEPSTDDESDDQTKIRRQNALDKDSSDDTSSSSNPFGYIRYYNPQTGIETEIEKYESFIDYGESSPKAMMVADRESKKSIILTSTARLQLVNQLSETSNTSSVPTARPCMACEDLPNLDCNVQIENLNSPLIYVPTTRQSLPSKFVGNKFNESSLTTIPTPSWTPSAEGDKMRSVPARETNISNYEKSCSSIVISTTDSSSCSTTTHSSSIDLPINTLPLPDKMVAELLYNFDSDLTKSESVESDRTELSSRTVIKPPKMFENSSTTRESLNLGLNNVGFRKHSFNSDKPRRRYSVQLNPDTSGQRCVSYQYVELSTPNWSSTSSCRCCTECCQSPRSSDSGMAGSYTLNSPDVPPNVQERCSTDMTNLCHKYCGDSRHVISLTDMDAKAFESQCPCTSPFGSTPRTSCQLSVSENILTGAHDSTRTSVTSSLDYYPPSIIQTHSKNLNCPQPSIPNKQRCVQRWEQPTQRSKSLTCIPDSNIKSKIDVDVEEQGRNEIFRSGLYAHWWLKAKIPKEVLRGIYEETRTRDAGKGLLKMCFRAFVYRISNIQPLSAANCFFFICRLN